MANDCRAKDPDSCRVHGTSGTYDKLQAIAHEAAKAGNSELYMKTRAEIDALNDEGATSVSSRRRVVIPKAAVEAGASIDWTPEAWQSKSETMKELARQDAIDKLTVAAPYLYDGEVNDTAINAVAKHRYESRGNGEWHKAGTEDRVYYLRRAHKVLAAAAPHMKPKPNRFKISSEEKANLENHLTNVTGLNVIYRKKMRSILKSGDNEMPRLKEMFDEISNRERHEGVRLMGPEFRKGFITHYNTNVKPENQITE